MLTIEVHDQAVRAALDALQRRVANMAPALQAIGEGMVTRTKGRFDTSTDPAGGTWKPKKRPDGRKTLVGDSGDLRRQITASVAGNALTVRASAVYAAIHQFGGTIQRAAYSKQVRHRTDAKGQLLRSAIMGGRGLVFAKDSHKRAVTRWFEVGAHSITIPARPFLPIRADGSLYPAEQREIVAQIEAWLAGRDGA
ncbi:MAG: phage virion morphogenesis protein [Burkholderiaceae bacterium]|nr:phage virion morphogenesis protein [Burkholderiaceae bacterium]